MVLADVLFFTPGASIQVTLIPQVLGAYLPWARGSQHAAHPHTLSGPTLEWEMGKCVRRIVCGSQTC